MNWDHRALASLNEILANIYSSDSDARRIATKVGLKPAFLTFEGKAIASWFSVLQAAKGTAGLVDAIVAAALEENPGDEQLKQARDHAPPLIIKGPDLVGWRASPAETREKIMGARSTLVPIAYLQIGVERSRSVVRVKRGDGGAGSGFVTEGNLLITNNHVLASADEAGTAVVQFNYQQLPGGTDATYEEAILDPKAFFKTSVVDDWSAVRIKGDLPTKWGMVPLRRAPIRVGDHVNIIQHPGGGPKQVSFFANVIMYVGDGRVQYLTDTLPGSSGSPVFDLQWNIIALHHSGGWLYEPNAPAKTTYYRNEGISIDRIIDALAGQ